MEDTLQIPSRESVYRYILDSLADAPGKSQLLGIAIFFAYPAICSPKVSTAIREYLEVKYRPSEKLVDHQEKLLAEGKFFSELFSHVLLWAQLNINYHRSLPKAFDAIVEAMCWELETTREAFLGN